MAVFTQTYTNNGLTQLAGTISNTYTVTRIAAGSGTQGVPATATALAAQKISAVTLGAATVLSPGQYVIQATINSNNYSGTAFVLTELGLFGTISSVGGGAELMTMYVKVANGPTIENNTTNPQQSIYLVFNVAVSNSSNVSVTVGTGVFALESDFVTHLADPAAHPQAFINPVNLCTTTQQGMIPQSTGTSLNAMTDTVPISWQPFLPAIAANVTLFVAVGASNVYPNYSSVQNALNYVSNYFIETGVTVTISVGPGTFTVPFTVNHPQGAQINIVGTTATATGTSATIVLGTGVVTITGSAGAFSGFAIGDMVIISNTQTNPGIEISGCWVLTAQSSTTISYQSGYSSLLTPGTLTGVTSIAVTRLRTQLSFASGNAIVCNSNLGVLQNVGVIKTGTPVGVAVSAGNNVVVGLTGVGFNGWADSTSNSVGAVAQSGSIINCTSCYASDGTYGLLSQLGQINAASCFVTSGTNGFSAQSSLMTVSNSFAYGNSGDGFSVVNSGTLTVSNCASEGNAVGIRGTVGSMILQGNGGAFNNNTGTDVILSITSDYVKTTGASATVGTKSANIISNNTLTADGCYYSP